MGRRCFVRCPKSMSKYGFCGLLAVIYAAKLEMPANLIELQNFFEQVKQVLLMKKTKWKHAAPKNQGGISFENTISLLKYYNTCNFEEIILVTNSTKKNANVLDFATWLQQELDTHTCYIGHVDKHAFFVNVGAVKSKWRLYDQKGVQRKVDLSTLTEKGGYGRMKLANLMKITDKNVYSRAKVWCIFV